MEGCFFQLAGKNAVIYPMLVLNFLSKKQTQSRFGKIPPLRYRTAHIIQVLNENDGQIKEHPSVIFLNIYVTVEFVVHLRLLSQPGYIATRDMALLFSFI